MRKLMLFFCLLLSACALQVNSQESKGLYPSIDLPIPTPLPKHFRMPSEALSQVQGRMPTLVGLDKMKVSASAQMTECSLIPMLYKLPNKKVIVVDLREESHGYVNGIPFSWKMPETTWTNINKTLVEIEQDEQQLLKKTLGQKTILLDPESSPLRLNVSSVYTEKDLMAKHGLGYVRIPVTENHKPSDQAVEQIMQLIRTLPQDSWLHVHCHGGRGRTTTFLVMYDIMLNCRQVSLDDILLRHQQLGGSDLLKKLDLTNPRHIPLHYRLIFLKQFYDYCKNNDVSKVSWTSWSKSHPCR